MARSHFGTVRKLDSGKHQARFVGPDNKRHSAGTYPTVKAARAALAAIQTDITEQGAAWQKQGVDTEQDDQTHLAAWAVRAGLKYRPAKPKTFETFAAEVMRQRKGELKPRTIQNYESLLKLYLLPTFGHMPLATITVQRVDMWWTATGTTTGLVNRRNAYFLLSRIMKQAVRYKLIPASPCMVAGAGKNVAKPRPYLSLEDFARIVAATPSGLHAAFWTLFGSHLRISELCALNRGDVDLETGLIAITKQVQQVKGQGLVMAETKTGNQRTIKMLAPAVDALAIHLDGNDDPADAPLFRGPKGGRLSKNYIYGQWVKAASAVGLPGAHQHDVRHTSLTLVAAYGSLKETMNRGGHSTPAAALRYQHASQDRDSLVADAASAAFQKQKPASS